jgi:hypothetical protein
MKHFSFADTETLLSGRLLWIRGQSEWSGHAGSQSAVDTRAVRVEWTRGQSEWSGHADSQSAVDTRAVRVEWTRGQSEWSGHAGSQSGYLTYCSAVILNSFAQITGKNFTNFSTYRFE